MKKRLLPFVSLILFAGALRGQVWSPKAAGVLPMKFNIADICIVNEQVVWAVAFDWTPVYNGQPVPAAAVAKLLKSTDGGENWTATDIEEAKGRVVWDIHAFDENTACITSQDLGGGPGRGIFRTADGGENWTETFHHVAGGGVLHFFNDTEGVCINYNAGKHIARTTDGGATWALVPPANIPNLLSGEGSGFSSASNALGTFGDMACFGTTSGRLIKTEDRGLTWTATTTGLGSNSQLQSMGFADEKNGLAISWLKTTSTDEIVRTTDGGLSWLHTGHFGFYEVDAVPCSNTFMAAAYWTDKRTAISSDFGTTWATVDSTIDAAGAVFNTPEFGWMLEAAQAGVGTGPALYKWVGDPLYGRTYVRQNATGANNGRGWADAYTDLQTALAAAQAGDEIWVAEGVYRPDTASGSQAATFFISLDVKLQGGFAGTECSLAERDPVLHPTVLSGDLNGDDVPDDFSQKRGDNVAHVVGVSNALIDGFFIQGGQADNTGQYNNRGGGMICFGKPLIQRCVFEQNYASGGGGGLFIGNQPPNVSDGVWLNDCLFRNNSGNEGGALSVSAKKFTVENCQFLKNKTHNGALDANGGGIYLFNPDSGVVRNCRFLENTATDAGGGLYAWTNSSSTQASLAVENCRFENNTAQTGIAGAMYLAPWGDNGNYTFYDCHFQGNTASNGGALVLEVKASAGNAKALLDRCTYSENQATAGDCGGFLLIGAGKNMDVALRDCRFFKNSAVNSEAGAAGFLGIDGATGTVRVDSCVFENNTALVSGALEMLNLHNGGAQVSFEVTNSIFKNNQSDVEAGAIGFFSGEISKSSFLVENCVIDSNTTAGTGGGVVMGTSSADFHVKFRRTQMTGNKSTGAGGACDLYVEDLPSLADVSVLFENCLLAGNTSAGAAVAADSLASLQFRHCTIADNTGGGIQLSGYSTLTLQNTILHNPGFAEYTAVTNDASVASLGGNLLRDGSLAAAALPYDLQNTDPLFAAPDNYRLSDTSPAIDQGVDLGNLPATDLDGSPRVNGCPDIGAYESATVVSTDCVVGTEEAWAAGSLRLWPNPAVDFLSIEGLENAVVSLAVQVFDAMGRLVLEKGLDGGQVFDVQEFAPGFYVLRAKAGERIFAGKFVKQ